MNFIISYHFYKLKRRQLDKELKEIKDNVYPIQNACSLCGQNPYLCQCENNSHLKYCYPKEPRIFNPEKDNY